MTVPGLERGEIGRHQVDLAADRLRLAGLEAADAKVGMGADDHALEELLVGLPGGGDELFAIGGDAADQTARGNDRRQGTRVDIVATDAGGAPDLAGGVKRLFGPGFDGKPDRLTVLVDETMRQVSFAVVLEFRAGVSVDSNTRLSPVRLRAGCRGILRDDPEINFIAAGGDLMVDHDAVVEKSSQMDRAAARARRDELGLVGNDRSGPVASCGARPAESLDVPDFEGTAGKMAAMDAQDLFSPGKREFALGCSGGSRERGKCDQKSGPGKRAANQRASLLLRDGVGRTSHLILSRIQRGTICV